MAARWWDRRGRPGTVAAVVGAFLLLLGASVVGLVRAAQRHAPQPVAAQAGTLGPPGGAGSGPAPVPASSAAPSPGGGASAGAAAAVSGAGLPASSPVSIAIPAIGVAAPVNRVGLNADGTIQVPPLGAGAVSNEPAWYTRSPTPGQVGASVILGHVDSATQGPADFFGIGSLRPGDEVDVTRRDGTVAVFTVDGVRSYPKASFPHRTVFGPVPYAALRLVTFGRSFEGTTGHDRRTIVVYASLQSAHPAA